MKYNHAYDIAFSLESNHEFGEDVTPVMYETALLNRIKTWTMQMSGERFTRTLYPLTHIRSGDE